MKMVCQEMGSSGSVEKEDEAEVPKKKMGCAEMEFERRQGFVEVKMVWQKMGSSRGAEKEDEVCGHEVCIDEDGLQKMKSSRGTRKEYECGQRFQKEKKEIKCNLKVIF